jgi:hypothetical protein
MGPPGLKQLSLRVAELRLDINVETALPGGWIDIYVDCVGCLLDMNVEL